MPEEGSNRIDRALSLRRQLGTDKVSVACEDAQSSSDRVDGTHFARW
jgi:hypothetical protein